jgi:DNA invertase Pin-like site-specific DNA recombinase
MIPAGSDGIVYVRVSTAHQAEDELPADSQLAERTAAVERAGCDDRAPPLRLRIRHGWHLLA